eukprot:Phypoly_transcript_00767.p1 GENE.Phypoly_transcript_00767~~Phypoly_transcript_00767.p1  ORF type:complete len:887 (+),score=142.43 Phypoly_transcript_00767:204-2864(+)
MKEKKEPPSPLSQLKDSEEGFHFMAHRRTSSFSSLAKAYRLKSDKSRTKLNKSATNDADDTQQLIAVLEHQVSEGDKARRELVLEITKLKDQLHRAEAQIALLKQANNALQGQLLNKEKSPQLGRFPVRPIDVQLCLNGELKNESMDSARSDSSLWSDPLNATIYADSSMHDDSTSEQESDFNINTIINNVNVNTYNNINNIQVNNINELNYVIGINNVHNITNYNNTNNYHIVNNISTNSIVNNSFSSDSPLSNSNSSNISSSPSKTKDALNESLNEKEKERKLSRLFTRNTSHHKRRGSDTESTMKLDDKYIRRHSEGKVLRIAGLREQIRQEVLQILNTTFADSEDEWPAVHALLQGVELDDSVLPPAPRHLVHAGFVREGDHIPEGYWIDDVLLLLFKDFLLIAVQPKGDLPKAKYQFKEVITLSASARVHSWATDTEHSGIGITTDKCARSFIISSKEECDKWISVITKHISALSVRQGTLRHYLIAQCDAFVVEPTTAVTPGETKLCLDEPRKGIYHYQSFFYSKPHINYVGGSTTLPVVISIEDKTTKLVLSPSMFLRRTTEPSTVESDTITHRVLVRAQSGDECVCVAIHGSLARSAQTAHTEILTQLPHLLPSFTFPQLKINGTLFRVKSPDLENDLLQYEANNMRRSHKIGVVYCAKGARTEAEMLQTTHAQASPDFHQFLSLLGSEVPLKLWEDYAGGLDVKNDADGTHSVFTNFWGIPIMFHVSTMLPNDPHNPNVAKKRHIGNDIVVIVFKDHDDDTLFNPSTFKSHLNHIFCVVQHVNDTGGSVSYRVSFCAKEGIGGFQPVLPNPPVFPKDAKFKHFLLAKVVNAERAAMRSAPFAKRHTLARFTFLKNLWKQYNLQPKEIDESCNQVNTM